MMLLDSVILIDHFNDIDKATKFIKKYHGEISISLITRVEVLCGFDNKNTRDLAKMFLDEFELYEMTVKDIDLATELCSEKKLKLPDALQAAIAINRELKLVTRNTKDFDPRKFSFVHIPYRI